jgi:hypothetical protein
MINALNFMRPRLRRADYADLTPTEHRSMAMRHGLEFDVLKIFRDVFPIYRCISEAGDAGRHSEFDGDCPVTLQLSRYLG